MMVDEGFRASDTRHEMAQISESLTRICRLISAANGTAFDLRAFYELVMKNGIAPWWAHRQLLLPGDAGPVVQ